MIDAVRQFFEDHAPTWDDRMPDDIQTILRTFAAPLADTFSTAQNILEIGTGTGAFVPAGRCTSSADCAGLFRPGDLSQQLSSLRQ